MRRTARWLLVALVAAGAGCTDGGDGVGDEAVESDGGAVAASSTSDGAGSPPSTTTTTTVPTTAGTSTTSTTVIPTVPESGVPGIGSDDDFCSAWSEFAGTFQALALAASFAADPDAARRAEVIAAPAVVAAVEDLDGALPEELESERDTVLSDLVGPFGRRAQRAVDALVQAGVPPDAIAELGDLWLRTLVERGVDDPDITVDVPADVDASVSEAVTTFVAEVPPIPQDPSLVTDAEAPRTESYLSANCPDQGTLAGNDVIGG